LCGITFELSGLGGLPLALRFSEGFGLSEQQFAGWEILAGLHIELNLQVWDRDLTLPIAAVAKRLPGQAWTRLERI
jgi:hypothetical protein